MPEKHRRSILKAVSWRVFATATTVIISYIITGNIKFAASIGFIEVIAKIFLYYIHERLWDRFNLWRQSHETVSNAKTLQG